MNYTLWQRIKMFFGWTPPPPPAVSAETPFTRADRPEKSLFVKRGRHHPYGSSRFGNKPPSVTPVPVKEEKKKDDSTTLSDMLTGAAIGYAVGHSSSHSSESYTPTPSPSYEPTPTPTPDFGGGGGDFGGGGSSGDF